MNSWLDLPPEILELICDGVEYPYDVRRIRSVCRSWRSSVVPPAGAFSPLFPHRISASSPPFTAGKNHHRPIDLITMAVYLLRSHSDPSNAWMVSMEEANAGKLRLRHPITDDPIEDISPPDLPSSGWSVTEIARSHSFCFADGTAEVLRFDDWWTLPLSPEYRGPNKKMATTGKVILVPNPSPNTKRSRISDFTSFVLYNRLHRVSALQLSDDGTEVLQHVRFPKHKYEGYTSVHDIVNFNGQVFSVDCKARVYSIDPQTLVLTRIDDSHLEMPWQIFRGRKRLIVSNGELYMFAKFYDGNCFNPPANACVVYKLVVMQGDDEDDAPRRLYKWEYVESVGDQVFFITVDFSYSVSAQHLPYPWRGNCVVLDTEGVCPCVMNARFPKQKEIEVFHLGGGQLSPISCCYGYSNLFTTSNSMLNNTSTSSDCFDEFVAGKSFTYMELPPDKKANLFNPACNVVE